MVDERPSVARVLPENDRCGVKKQTVNERERRNPTPR